MTTNLDNIKKFRSTTGKKLPQSIRINVAMPTHYIHWRLQTNVCAITIQVDVSR